MFVLNKSYQLKFPNSGPHLLCSDQRKPNTMFILSYDLNKQKKVKISSCIKICTPYLMVSISNPL